MVEAASGQLLLLARQGVEVTLLEAGTDLERDFRGDIQQPSTLELRDQLGLMDQLPISRTARSGISCFTRGRAPRQGR
ncbi:MAG TPA: FAD-dependent monooxygenase [Chloroflexota bacterium]